jgi:hypothetical protein
MPCTKVAVGDFVTEGERLAAEVVHEYLAARPESWVQIVNVLAHLGTMAYPSKGLTYPL